MAGGLPARNSIMAEFLDLEGDDVRACVESRLQGGAALIIVRA